MALFAKTAEFDRLNVGFALDEGIPTETDEIPVYNTERMICRKNIYFPAAH